MGDFQSALDDWFGHASAMKSRYGGSDAISEFRDAGNLDDVYAAARLKYPVTVDDEVNRLTAERVNSRAPGPGGAAYSPEQWREYFGGVVPQQRAAQAEQQQFDDTRTPLNRLLSADAFAVSAPIRMLTGGQYGASNLLEMLPAYRGAATAIARGEQDFARANEGALETIAQAGESAMALPGLQELGAIEGGIGGTLKAMRNTKAANALDRLLPTADDASRTMSMSGVTPKANALEHMEIVKTDDGFKITIPGDNPKSPIARAIVEASPNNPGEFHVGNVWVRDDMRGKGIARGIYDKVKSEVSPSKLTPSTSLKRAGYEFWNRYDPAAVAGDLRSNEDAVSSWIKAKHGNDVNVNFRDGGDSVSVFKDGRNVREYTRSELVDLGVPLGGVTPKAESTPALTAYHGSPHKFDKFDVSKVGTGDGRNDIAHGIYLASRRQDAEPFKKGDAGHLYEVSLSAGLDEFIDLSKPLNEQSDYVRNALNSTPWAKRLADDDVRFKGGISIPNGKEASEIMRNAGIKGVVYKGYDTKRSPNYVVFDDRVMSIIDGPKAENGILAMDEASRMGRAREMGFRDIKLYHGTSSDISEFDPSLGGRTSRSQAGQHGVWTSLYPDVAEDFANQAAMAQNTAQMNLPGMEVVSGQNIIPLLHRADKPGVIHLNGDEMNHEIAATLADSWENGYDAIMLKNYRGGNSIVVVKDPSQLRSTHAAFDPKRKSSRDLLAGIGGAAIAAPAAYDEFTSRRD